MEEEDEQRHPGAAKYSQQQEKRLEREAAFRGILTIAVALLQRPHDWVGWVAADAGFVPSEELARAPAIEVLHILVTVDHSGPLLITTQPVTQRVSSVPPGASLPEPDPL